MILLPTERCAHAMIRLRYGQMLIPFTCTHLQVVSDGDGALTKVSVEGQRGFPHYVSLPDVVLVSARMGWRTRRLRWWEWASWAAALGLVLLITY